MKIETVFDITHEDDYGVSHQMNGIRVHIGNYQYELLEEEGDSEQVYTAVYDVRRDLLVDYQFGHPNDFF